MKIISIVGARPQFIKAGVVSKAIADHSDFREITIHTGQHYDADMSDIFFSQLRIPTPHYQLKIHESLHGEMTGKMLIEIENVLLKERPDLVFVYGDTNSTLAGALASSKLHIPIAHVEAGLRSFNMRMPEEINRIMTDQISDILFCPTQIAVNNLENEGFSCKKAKIELVGDVMQDSALLFAPFARRPQHSIIHDHFILATIHRAENTDDPRRLADIVKALNRTHKEIAEVVIPLHPRTDKALIKAKLELKVNRINPVGYLEMLWLLQNTALVVTDSGGVQKEAFFFNKACVTLREETEWAELVNIGANELVGSDRSAILASINRNIGRVIRDNNQLYGGGKASKAIIDIIKKQYDSL